tara:strand:+ start:35183 stop:39247 length:4065 start_codon:yes stop_codon:yes gene_type:complete
MSCKFKYKGEEYSEQELIQVLSNDPDIISKYGIQEQRVGLDGYDEEDLDMFQRKVDHLKKSMNVEVILDTEVETSRVLGSEDPRTKSAGKPVILINPDAIFKTTAIHEFAHIFIDSFPKGLDNPRFKRALADLEGTDLWNRVKALYPDLSEEMFHKEVLATAIGEKGSDIWDSNEKANAWENFKGWLFDYLRRTFGLDSNQVESLTRDLLSGRVNKDLMSEMSINPQEQRNEFKNKEDKELKDKVKNIDTTFNEALSRVIALQKTLAPDTLEKIQKERRMASIGKETRYSSINDIVKALEKYQDADKRKGLVQYLLWAKKEMKYFAKITEDRKLATENNEPGGINDDKLIKSINWNEVFDNVKDIRSLLNQMHTNKEVSLKEYKLFRNVIKDIESQRGDIATTLLEMSRDSYANLMADNDNMYEAKYQRQYELEYEELTSTRNKTNPLSKTEYVYQKLNDNREMIREEAYQDSLDKSERSLSDLKYHAGRLFSEKNANSRDIQVLSKLVDDRERSIQAYANSYAAQFDKHHKEFMSAGNSSLNQKTKYEGMYEVSSSGNHYYAGQYSPEFYETRKQKIQETHDSDFYEETYKDIDVDSASLKYTIDKVEKKLQWDGAYNINVAKVNDPKNESPMHVTYRTGEEIVTISLEYAIARSEMQAWQDENTRLVPTSEGFRSEPTKVWESESWNKLSKEKKDELVWLKAKVKEADIGFKGMKSLIRKYGEVEFIKFPSVMKSDISRISEGQTKDLLSHKFSSLIKTQADEFDEGNRAEGEDVIDDSSSIKVFATVANKERLRVPIPFRAKLEAKDQSLDMHSITLMNLINSKNHSEKTDMESTFLVVLDVMKKRKVAQRAGPGWLSKLHAITGDVLWNDATAGLTEDSKKAQDILENRIYGIKNKESGEIYGVQVHKAAQSILKYSGAVALLGNWANSVINLNMGTLSNVLEAVGGEVYNLKDWKDAGIEYWKDMNGIMQDWGKNVDSSRTNLFMNAWNVMGDKAYLHSRFEETSKVQTLMKTSTLRPIAKGGEHMMQAKVMYAVLKSIKAMNAKGQYINKAGDVVKNKKDAASLDQMIEFKRSKINGSISMQLDPNVEATSFTASGGADKILLETRNLIKHKIAELHGLYDSDLQAAIQRNFIGKMGFFLRKWMIPGALRRWRGATSMLKDVEELREVDKFYSQDAKANLEGYHVTAVRFFAKTLVKAVMELNMAIVSKRLSEMTPRELANIRKSVTELAMIAIMWIAYGMMDDDDDENVIQRYIMRRQISELAFFVSPVEGIKIASTPTAAIGTLKRIINLSVQVLPGNIFDEFDTGSRVGQNKALYKAKQLVPLLNFKDTEKFKDGLDFLKNASAY